MSLQVVIFLCRRKQTAAFLKALSLYVERNAGGVADFDALEEALYEATGSRWDGYLLDWLAS